MDYAADGDGAERTLRALHAALAALRGIVAATLSEQLASTATLFIQCLGSTS
jgi:hypothetical protein